MEEGSLRDIKEKQKLREAELVAFEDFNVRTVHVNAVLSGSVLGITVDLTDAIRGNNLLNIKRL
jgi:phosphoenolpyruvate carboxylase